ncbi:hypothetical protein [Flavimaricola marinus]|uniref:Uncharacterized protein n=1 Tax=Flavimaricola marinus TaxID=1819565 RepID=A0A238LBH7_9RHOB|nr:hypothetical protein [Flavimaricola marinus]SMY06913.1 hypothetical protein LOM8899_01043 [Flavimaricola marinus]
MMIDRKIGFAPRTTAAAKDIAQLQGPCVGCSDCRGLCAALIEALTLPDIILSKKA